MPDDRPSSPPPHGAAGRVGRRRAAVGVCRRSPRVARRAVRSADRRSASTLTLPATEQCRLLVSDPRRRLRAPAGGSREPPPASLWLCSAVMCMRGGCGCLSTVKCHSYQQLPVKQFTFCSVSQVPCHQKIPVGRQTRCSGPGRRSGSSRLAPSYGRRLRR